MGIRVGIDLVRVSEVRDALAAHGERYLRRVYTDAEVADAHRRGTPDPLRLAARFAAKEAAMKVLRVGDTALNLRTIEVVRDPGGFVELALHDDAAALARDAGITDLAVSLTHEEEYASAVVVAQL
ncbi:holo-[acyl-carrier-protein] synthase [Baekduia soli]|uniref:Holo-[acyl-carrier-protein] synthase n=1 Tax=Baekduia soli TaxID=496014 RepID=A0A5B8U1Q9_9ACTN|nr:holo-ACP synthase [Baekduia soli]QEC46898.1 holo-[acyl-carrier-protein] synthase [Baekduia soli]